MKLQSVNYENSEDDSKFICPYEKVNIIIIDYIIRFNDCCH